MCWIVIIVVFTIVIIIIIVATIVIIITCMTIIIIIVIIMTIVIVIQFILQTLYKSSNLKSALINAIQWKKKRYLMYVTSLTSLG